MYHGGLTPVGQPGVVGKQQRVWEEPQMNLLTTVSLLWALQATLPKPSQEARQIRLPQSLPYHSSNTRARRAGTWNQGPRSHSSHKWNNTMALLASLLIDLRQRKQSIILASAPSLRGPDYGAEEVGLSPG